MKKLTLLFWFLILSTFITIGSTTIAPLKHKHSEIKKQQCIVNIVVTDEEGLTLPGVSIIVKGNNTGSATDAQGRCRIKIPVIPSTLVFSYLGFQTQEITVNCSQTTFSIKLKYDL